MNWRALIGPGRQPEEVNRYSLTDYLGSFTYGGRSYSYPLNQTVSTNKQEEFGSDFAGLATGAYKENGVVFACLDVRLKLFSEARFQYRQLRSGRPGDLFGTEDLAILEEPWPGATTGDLLARAIQDADLAGNFFAVRRPGAIKRLRPDWVTIILASKEEGEYGDVDTEVLGYQYKPGGPGSGSDPVYFLREEVAHFAPIPDPTASFRGMSWITPIIREIMGDSAARDHKLSFFENGATPNMIVKVDPQVTMETFKAFKEQFRSDQEGAANAYKTLFLGGGADATVVGANFEQMDFKQVQGASETRIAAAAGVPPVIVGLSEGLAAATYSNYGQARRRFADGTMRPLWRNIAGSLASIIDVPSGAELWYDDRDIPFLQEDVKDAADIQSVQAGAIRTLVDAGFKPDTVIDAVTSGDFARLEHTDLFSVQLQPPGSAEPPKSPEIPNGNGQPAAVRALVEAVEQIARKEKP